MRKAIPRIDFDEVMDNLILMQVSSPAVQMKFCDPATAARHVLHRMNEGHAYVVNGYYVQFDIGSPWHSTVDYLIEELILRIYPTTHKVESVIDALSEIAFIYNCSAVVAGDTQIGYMRPKYEAAGFITLGTQHFKEV